MVKVYYIYVNIENIWFDKRFSNHFYKSNEKTYTWVSYLTSWSHSLTSFIVYIGTLASFVKNIPHPLAFNFNSVEYKSILFTNEIIHLCYCNYVYNVRFVNIAFQAENRVCTDTLQLLAWTFITETHLCMAKMIFKNEDYKIYLLKNIFQMC